MPFSKQAINFLYQNSASIGKLFNLQEQKDFLLQFVTEKKIQKFLKANETNFDHVENMISYIKFENHSRLYEALIDRLKKIHVENGQFVHAMLQTCCERDVDGENDDTMIVTQKYKMEKKLMNSMKEILSDMKIICEENQNLINFEINQREMIANEVLSKEVTKSNAETKRLNSELGQSFDQIENLEMKVAELLSLQDMKGELPTSVGVKSNQRHLNTVDSAEIAAALFNLGKVHFNQDEFNAALDYHTQALEMSQRLHNGDHLDTALYLSKIAMDYNKLQQWNKSLEYHNKCLQMRRRLYSGDHENIAYTLCEIGLIHDNQNNYKEALDFYKEALQMAQRLYQGDHVRIATILNNIGLLHNKQNKFKKAVDYYTQALEMRQRLYNGDHVDIAQSLNNIAFVHKKSQDLIKSLDYFTRCLEMRRRLYPGGDHVDVKEAAANVERIKQLLMK